MYPNYQYHLNLHSIERKILHFGNNSLEEKNI